MTKSVKIDFETPCHIIFFGILKNRYDIWNQRIKLRQNKCGEQNFETWVALQAVWLALQDWHWTVIALSHAAGRLVGRWGIERIRLGASCRQFFGTSRDAYLFISRIRLSQTENSRQIAEEWLCISNIRILNTSGMWSKFRFFLYFTLPWIFGLCAFELDFVT